MQRRTFIKALGVAGGMMVDPSLFGKTPSSVGYDFPLTDLHVHLSDQVTIDRAMEIAERTKVKFGIVAHPVDWGIKDDAGRNMIFICPADRRD